MSYPLITYLIAMLLTSGIEGEGDWDEKSFLDLSARSSVFETRVVDGDTVDVPYDRLGALGLGANRGVWDMTAYIERERQIGEDFRNWRTSLKRDGDLLRLGVSMEDSEAYKWYLMNIYGEVKLGIVGIGLARNYTKSPAKTGSTLGRLSVHGAPSIGNGMTLVTDASFEFNPSRTFARGRIELKGLKLGPVAISPFYVINRVDRGDDVDPKTSWQFKVRSSISF